VVAFTIEADNEAEHRMAHRTTTGPAAGSDRGPWLTSLAMWANFLQLVPEAGLPADQMAGPAALTNLAGLRRWGLVALDGDRVRLTRAGRRLDQVWRPLCGEVEARWHRRFGGDRLGALAQALAAVEEHRDRLLPPYLPVLGFADGMRNHLPDDLGPAADPAASLGLLSSLARVLLSFALELEQASRLSVAVRASTLRVLDPVGVRPRHLPALTGASVEAVRSQLGFLERRGCVERLADPSAARGQVARLTERGRQAQVRSARLVAETEAAWRDRLGDAAVEDLDRALAAVVGVEQPSPLLLDGTEPHPDGWRAARPRPATLPWYPLVLHRGGYPDGS